MASSTMKRWLLAVALLAAAAIVPACDAAGAGNAVNPGNTSAIWTPVNSGGGTYFPSGLVWRDANLGPIAGGYPLGGDMTFDQAGAIDEANGLGTNPFPGNSDPVSTANAQSAAEEQAIESEAYSDYVTWANSLQGGAGGAGVGQFGGVGGVGQGAPSFTAIGKMRLEPRAECKHATVHMGAAEGAPNSLTWRLIKCGVNPALQNPYNNGGPVAAADAVTAYNMMTGANARIMATQGAGWFGGGYWTAGGTKYYSLVIISLPLGLNP